MYEELKCPRTALFHINSDDTRCTFRIHLYQDWPKPQDESFQAVNIATLESELQNSPDLPKGVTTVEYLLALTQLTFQSTPEGDIYRFANPHLELSHHLYTFGLLCRLKIIEKLPPGKK